MNWVDIIIGIVILIATFLGYKRGFFKSLYMIIAFFIAIFLAFSFYRPLATYLKNNTGIDEWIITNIQGIDNINLPNETENEKAQIQNNEGKALAIEETLENLPENIKEMIGFEDIKNQALGNIAYKLSDLALNIISMLSIYIVARLVLGIVCKVVDELLKLPILKQINELLGILLGIILGFIQVYIIFAVVTFLSSIININPLIATIKGSMYARILYENNLIISFLF